jgi:hypothetical protein
VIHVEACFIRSDVMKGDEESVFGLQEKTIDRWAIHPSLHPLLRRFLIILTEGVGFAVSVDIPSEHDWLCNKCWDTSMWRTGLFVYAPCGQTQCDNC